MQVISFRLEAHGFQLVNDIIYASNEQSGENFQAIYEHILSLQPLSEFPVKCTLKRGKKERKEHEVNCHASEYKKLARTVVHLMKIFRKRIMK